MAIVSQACALAFHAMACLPEPGKTPIRIQELAGRLDLSAAHMAKVLSRLVQGRLLKSSRGPGGGFVLARAPADIRMSEVYECISGGIEEDACVFDAPRCSVPSCAMAELFHELNRQLLRVLKATRLSDVRLNFKPDKERCARP